MWRAVWSSWAPFASMIIVMLGQSSGMVFVKFAMSEGTDKFIVMLYCNCLSTLFLIFPCLLILRRPNSPPLTPGLFLRFFALALSGFIAQVFTYAGIDYSSATLGTALMNLIPAFTFILSVILRLEILIWKRPSSQAKVVGTMVSVVGAFAVTLYKGPPITLSTSLTLLDSPSSSSWALGGFLLAVSAFLIALYYIVQAKIVGDYPVLTVILFFYNLFVVLQGTLLSLITVRDSKAWAVGGSSLIAIICTAMICLIHVGVTMWCVKIRGPLYVAMFQPIGIIFTVVLGIVLLGDPLCIGSLIGAVVIVGGFYGVMWGKAKEGNASEPSDFLPQTTPETPLLAQQCLAKPPCRKPMLIGASEAHKESEAMPEKSHKVPLLAEEQS